MLTVPGVGLHQMVETKELRITSMESLASPTSASFAAICGSAP
jgi:hypothetical protein